MKDAQNTDSVRFDSVENQVIAITGNWPKAHTNFCFIMSLLQS
jgi:hypothetical protein